MKSCKLLFVFFIVMMWGFGFAESTLKDLGYEGFEAKGLETTECKEVIFAITDPGTEFTPIFSIKAEFLPVKEKNASVYLALNTVKIAEFRATEFRCSADGCWARATLTREQIKEENTLKICAKTSKTTTSITVSDESMIGYYKMPVFREEDFKKCIMLENSECVENYSATAGEDLNIIVSITNSGTALSFVDLNSRIDSFGTRTAKKEMGQTHFEGSIHPGETKILNYPVRVEKAVPMSLPPAFAVYQDVFGETKEMSSNSVYIVPKSEMDLIGTLGIESVNHADKEAVVSLTLFNKERIAIDNVKVQIMLPEGLIAVNGTTEFEFSRMDAREAVSKSIVVRAEQEGEFAFNCSYSGDTTGQRECPQAMLEFKEENIAVLVGAIIFLAIIALAIYIYIITREDYSK